jgi:Dna[CI] antecedent, DciA
VLPVQSFAAGVIAEIIRRQPASKEKTAFAWSVAVGPALARVSKVELEGTTMKVRVADERWSREIERARPTILPRLRTLLGPDAITSIVVASEQG